MKIIPQTIVSCLLLLSTTDTHAQSCPTGWDWRTAATAPLSRGGTHPYFPDLYVVDGTGTVRAFDDETGAPATGFGAPTLGGTANGSPMLVELSDMTARIFVAARDGFVYALDPDVGTILWSYDTKRATCSRGPNADSLVATTAVVLSWICNFYSGCAGLVTDDLVLVGTKYGCGTQTANRVYTLDAHTGALVSVWNGNGATNVDEVSEGVALDYDRGQYFFGTARRRANDPSLFAIGFDGVENWRDNVGTVTTLVIPFSTGNLSARGYVATTDGRIRAFDPATGAARWSPATVSVGGGAQITVNPARGFGDAGNRIFAVAPNRGTVTAVFDGGSQGSVLWSLGPSNFGGASAASAPVVLPNYNAGSGREDLYVGTGKGTVLQIGPLTALTAAGLTVTERSVFSAGESAPTVTWVGADFNETFSTLFLLSTDSAGNVARWCVPFTP